MFDSVLGFLFFFSPVRDWLTDRIGPKALTSTSWFIESKEHLGRVGNPWKIAERI